ncbi:hypothetical protein BMS3Abin13_00957 [bacterium BMS3Abin13]|nr:hypothetical protein BMS3Abin13_00957 [bacterium BMS3Abin13]
MECGNGDSVTDVGHGLQNTTEIIISHANFFGYISESEIFAFYEQSNYFPATIFDSLFLRVKGVMYCCRHDKKCLVIFSSLL